MTQPLRIVVADDEPDMRDYFRKILPRLGHTVVAVAENGKDLVEQCRTHRPDLVITDIKMPDMDGIDAATAAYKDCPVAIILVSAYHDPELIRRAEADHVMGYLVKPIKQSDLEPAIALAIRRSDQFLAQRLRRLGLPCHKDFSGTTLQSGTPEGLPFTSTITHHVDHPENPDIQFHACLSWSNPADAERGKSSLLAMESAKPGKE